VDTYLDAFRLSAAGGQQLTRTSDRQPSTEEIAMPDLVYITLTLGSFALLALAIRGCERL
jgi:hypothetical protein